MLTRRFLVTMLVISLLIALPMSALAEGGPPPGKGPGGGEEETQGNNVSFPVIAVDGFSVPAIIETLFTVPYVGEYPGLTPDQVVLIEATGPWYPQKTEGNVWQAQVTAQASESVTFINWGDNIESVNPKLRRPFRLEVTLFKVLDVPMTAYTMAELEYPSSANELQGTNTTTYDSPYATVISMQPKLVVQYLGTTLPTDFTWDGTKWTGYTVIPVSFAPELNVGGKYIYGASEGGWKPDKVGYYRITFYIPTGSGIDLSGACIDNYPPADPVCGGITTEADEGGVATPVVDPANNLTYVDIQVVGGGGGGGGRP